MAYVKRNCIATKAAVTPQTKTKRIRTGFVPASRFCADDTKITTLAGVVFSLMSAGGFTTELCSVRNRSPPRERPHDTLPASPESVRVGHILSQSMCKTPPSALFSLFQYRKYSIISAATSTGFCKNFNQMKGLIL